MGELITTYWSQLVIFTVLVASYTETKIKVKNLEERHREKTKDVEKRLALKEARYETLGSELVKQMKEFEVMLARIDERLAGLYEERRRRQN